MYGMMTLICGPMFSGKTTELLKRILWARNGEGRRVQVFKPAFDTRYARTEIVSHEGLKSEAIAIREWSGIADETDIVFFDEVQFFCPPQFAQNLTSIAGELLRSGKNVVASGLDIDWRGEPFPVTAHMAALADEVLKLKGICSICGRPATKTFRRSKSGAKVALGGTESYESRCVRHWAEDMEPDLFSALSAVG